MIITTMGMMTLMVVMVIIWWWYLCGFLSVSATRHPVTKRTTFYRCLRARDRGHRGLSQHYRRAVSAETHQK